MSFKNFGRIVLGVALAAGVASAGTAPAGHKPAPPAEKVTVDAAALAGGDLEAAAHQATVLGDDGSEAGHAALADALATGLAPKVAAVAIASLARHPAPTDVALLRVYAGHRDEPVRAAAVLALGAYPDPVAKKTVVAALGDDAEEVRTAAAGAVAKGKIREGVERLFALLDKGDAAAPPALAALADADMAHAIGEHLGTAPAAVLAQTFGAILKRADFPEAAKVEVVRTLAKISGAEATTALTDYVDATPAKPPKKSRTEAQKIIEARLAGGGAQ
jgi:hypothetical protein